MRSHVVVVFVASWAIVLGSAGCDRGSDDFPNTPPPPQGGDPPVDAPAGGGGAVDARPDATSTSAGADLSIAVTDSPVPVDLSSTLTYTIDVVNRGDLDASKVEVTQRLPAGDVAFLSATGIDWTCLHDGQNVTCKRETLHVGPAPSIAVKVTTPPNSGSLTSTVHVSSATADSNLANNDAIAVSMVLAPDLATADLSVTMSDSPDPVQGIQPEGCGLPSNPACTIYLVAVNNLGPDEATELTVDFTLPGQGLFIEAVGAGWVCLAPSGRALRCTRAANLAIGAAPTISLTWKAPKPAGFSIEVAVAVSASSTDVNPSNDTAVEDTTVKP